MKWTFERGPGTVSKEPEQVEFKGKKEITLKFREGFLEDLKRLVDHKGIGRIWTDGEDEG